jgi:FKBP-type peptidyl-prolyl cis-trans isomerase
MSKISRNQWVAIAASIAVVGFFAFSGDFFSIFRSLSSETAESDFEGVINMPEPGFIVQDLIVGTGAEAKAGDFLTVHYVGALTTGEIFDSSLGRGRPYQFTLGAGEVISGWDQGVAGMKVGGKRRLVIPPDLGYGNQQAGPIPPNSTLIFEVELLQVQGR